jgi:hypothetical protein
MHCKGSETRGKGNNAWTENEKTGLGVSKMPIRLCNTEDKTFSWLLEWWTIWFKVPPSSCMGMGTGVEYPVCGLVLCKDRNTGPCDVLASMLLFPWLPFSLDKSYFWAFHLFLGCIKVKGFVDGKVSWEAEVEGFPCPDSSQLSLRRERTGGR